MFCSVLGPCHVPQSRPGKEKKILYTNDSGQIQKFPCNFAKTVNLQYSEAPVAKRLPCAVAPGSQ